MSVARPPHIPEEAWFAADERAWVVGERDAHGRPTGPHRSYRSDGTPWLLGTYRDGVPHGAFARFHPNGELARVGEFVDGKLHGLIEGFVSESPTNEGLRVCCVPPGAYRVEALYDEDSPVHERFFDREGRRLLSDGSLHPSRPESVPAEAIFEEGARGWALGTYSAQGQRQGRWSRWSALGVRMEERQFEGDKLHGLSRLFDGDGELLEEAVFDADVYHGPYLRRVPAGHYADTRIRQVRGAFAQGRAAGVWSYLDERGNELESREFAPLPSDLRRSPALDRAARSATEWLGVAQTLRQGGRAAEAVLAAARAAATADDPALLEAELLRATARLAPTPADELAATAMARSDGDWLAVADALQRGGEPASLLRHLASTLVPVTAAARELVDAALLLRPERLDFYVSRALVNLASGAPDAAERDVAKLAEGSEETRQFLLDYRRVLYPTFDFWPRRAPFDSRLPGIPDAPQQSLERMRAIVQKYATRLSLIREALLAQTGGESPWWMPPDVCALLPEGRVVLDKRTVVLEMDPEVAPTDGPTSAEIAIDETLDLDARDVASLMRLARTNWNGLTWACYACGLDDVGLPTALEAPADFAQAVGMAAERHWRARDRLTTAGLRALTRGLRGFTWEGMEIDTMTSFFAEIAAHEYTELRALLVFLCDEQAESPWQDDLRSD